VLAQRLVRTLCTHCKQQHEPDKEERALLGVKKGDDVKIFRAVGCEHCNMTGYRGRTGIHELIVVDEHCRELIHNGKGEQAIEKYIRSQSPSIRQDGFSKVLLGYTTLEEVLRVTREDA
jgi:general secretion pathway protein E